VVGTGSDLGVGQRGPGLLDQRLVLRVAGEREVEPGGEMASASAPGMEWESARRPSSVHAPATPSLLDAPEPRWPGSGAGQHATDRLVTVAACGCRRRRPRTRRRPPTPRVAQAGVLVLGPPG
jgi:hypothetical protein